MLFAGVAGACVLGVGLGLWARPGMAERRGAVPAAQPDAPPADPAPHKLQIVVDDRPPSADPAAAAAVQSGPLAKPVAAAFAPALPAATDVAAARALAPSPPPVVRVQTPLPPAPTAVVARPAAKPAISLPKLAPVMVAALAEMRSAEARLTKPIAPLVRLPDAPPPVHMAKAAPPVPPRAAAKPPHAAQLAQAANRAADAKAAKLAAAKAAAHGVELAKAAQAEKVRQADIQTAKLDQARAARLEKARLVQAQRAEQLKLAQAEAHGRAEAKAEARAEAVAEAREEARKQIRLASLSRLVRQILPQPHPAKAAPPAHTGRNDRKPKGRHDAVVERASLKPHKAPPRAPPTHTAPPPMIPAPRPAGLMKVSTRCASRDPGEALVCADPGLGAADRQLSRAYQGARAAGVPESQLQRQQQQWLAARAAAAREAPWAVRDVYLARIAELNSQAREAHGDGY